MTNKELLRAIIAEIDFIMHDKDYRFPESESTWYSRESCRVLTPEEVFEELRTELLQLNNETNREIAELQKQLEEKEKKIRQLDNEKGMLLNNSMKLLKEKDDKLKSQPAEIVEKIKEFVDGNAYYYEEEQYAKHIIKYLDDILKEYQK